MLLTLDNINVTEQQQNLQVKNEGMSEKCEGAGGSADCHRERVKLASYAEYKQYVRSALARRMGYGPALNLVRDNVQKLLSVWLLDLAPMHGRLRALYSKNTVGSRPYDPQILVRSLMLMAEFEHNSIKKWVRYLRSHPLLAIFAGADPKEMPQASTYYDFLMRLENGPYQCKCCHVVRPSEERLAKSRRLRAPDEKSDGEPEHDTEDRRGIIRRFMQEMIGQEQQPVPRDLAQRMNEMLLDLGVKKSAERGIIKDIGKLTLLGDGTAIKTAASPDGKPTCNCRQEGKYKCDCKRLFSDPTAEWGWDNRHKCLFYGYRLFQLVCADNRHNLPIYLAMAGAKRHETLLALECIARLRKEWRESKIWRMAFDSLYDMYPFYEYMVHCDYRYAIPYKKEPAACVSLGDGETSFNSQGAPLCPGGAPMRYHLTDRQKRQMYCCPIKRGTHKAGGKYKVAVHLEECPRHALCEPDSHMGPYVHVSPGIDPRIHPSIPRGTKEFKELHDLRSSCERSNSMKKTTYNADDLNSRVMPYSFIRIAIISILEHSRVWAMQILAPLREAKRLATAHDLMQVFI